MVTITIDGKKFDNVFQNMAQALAFAFQYGGCYAARKVEIAVVAESIKAVGGAGGKDRNPENSDANNSAVPGADKPLEEMSEKELEKLAKSLNIETGLLKIGLTDRKQKIIELIKAKQNEAPVQGGDKPLEEMTAEELIAYAESLSIQVGLVTQKEEIIALIKAAKEANPDPNASGN